MAGARCGVPAAAVLAFALGAAWAAGAEPEQQKLIDEIKVLRERVEQLETAQRPHPPLDRSPAGGDGDAAADAVLRDAGRRGSPALLASEGFTAGYSKGKFLIQDAAGNFLLRTQLHFMPRFAANHRQNAGGGTGDDFQTGFEIRRLTLGFDGNVFSPNATYLPVPVGDRRALHQ